MTTTNTRTTFVLLPGAWMGSWIWDEVADHLRDHGYIVHTPTLAGLGRGDRTHDVRLASHVQQIVNFLDENDLARVVLVGHSYSGLVAGQVADRRPERVSHTVFVQAFLPRDGRSLIDDWSDDAAARNQEIEAIATHGGTWEAPVAGIADEPDLSTTQCEWLASRLVDHPGSTVTDPVQMTVPVEKLNATYLASIPDDTAPLPEHIAALVAEPTWTVDRIRAGHWPMVSVPATLADRLEAAAHRSESTSSATTGTTAVPPLVRRLLDEASLAHIATIMPDGSPHSVPVWVGIDGENVAILTAPGSRKSRNIARDPRVSISMTAHSSPTTMAQVRGRVIERIDGDRAWTIIDRLSIKYLGQRYPLREDRVVLLIQIEHAWGNEFG
jgi:PPOX class probable F420-dependent enzyme